MRRLSVFVASDKRVSLACAGYLKSLGWLCLAIFGGIAMLSDLNVSLEV